MNIVCAPAGIVDIYRPTQGIIDIKQAGFHNIMIDASLCCSEHEIENIGKKKKQQLDKEYVLVSEHPEELVSTLTPFLQAYKKEELSATIAYAPYLKRDTKHIDLTKLLVTLTEESIKLCGKIGCSYLVVRPLFAGIHTGEEWEENRRYYLNFLEIARENNVMILLENQCSDKNGHMVRGVCADPREAAEWIDRLNEEAGEERFGFCMDVGACSLCGQNMQEFTMALGARIKAVRLRDCDGNQEASMLPFTCVNQHQPQTDWLNVIRGLRQIGFDGQLILDFADTAGGFSPILRPQLMQLAGSVAEYFKWQIELENLLKKYQSIVLFGAGNMCRNYMKCYGEQYPPLFTCDNNRSLWGSGFCGLEVRPPKSLLELPKDCAIFICNIYYREIERQLRDLGVENPIEFFNDEYMPSFYFDRLKERR